MNRYSRSSEMLPLCEEGPELHPLSILARTTRGSRRFRASPIWDNGLFDLNAMSAAKVSCAEYFIHQLRT